jgi:hypothetical protein
VVDGFPCLALAGDPYLPTMQETALRTMARMLDFKSLACQESALHGLGHWQGTGDRRVSAYRRLPRGKSWHRRAPHQLCELGPL